MSSSGSSSDDECNIYVNAARKLNALNRKIKKRISDDEEYEEVDQFTKNSKSYDLFPANDDKSKHECLTSSTTEEVSDEHQEKETISVNVNKDSVILIEDNDIPNGYPNTRNKRVTRNSNKPQEIPNKDIAIVELNDNVEEDSDEPYNDASLLLAQDESDNYIMIGSPSPSNRANSDNYEVSIKVLWRSNKMERFEIQRYETFQKVFQHFANLEGVSEDQIFITKKEKRITPFDTPASIDWSVIDILDGGIVSAEMAKKKKANSGQDVTEENICKVKIQASDKKFLTVTLKHNETFASLKHSCSEQLNIPEPNIKFYCDGELIDDETPESLDFDNEACIDLKISK